MVMKMVMEEYHSVDGSSGGMGIMTAEAVNIGWIWGRWYRDKDRIIIGVVNKLRRWCGMSQVFLNLE